MKLNERNLLSKVRETRKAAGNYIITFGNTYLRGAMMWEQEDWNENIKCAIVPTDAQEITGWAVEPSLT